jgi:ATP-binding cassette, subfamily B, bacterial
MDCGPACLKIISKYYQKNFSLKFLRDRCYITREGVSLFDIGRAAEDIGFRTLAIKIKFDDLRYKMPLPVVVHWKQKHFVVVYKVTRKKVYVSDPAQGLVNYSHKEFCESWEMPNSIGAVLVLETTPEFFEQEDNETKAAIGHFMKYLKPYHKYLAQVIVGMVAGILIGLLSPFISQAMVDFGIGGGNISFINTMLIAGLILAVSSMASGFIQSRIMLYVSERVNMSMVSDFLRKTLRLPVEFFERKMVSDLLTRIGDHNRIQSFIMSTFLGIFINILLIIIYSLLMLYYEANMFIVFMIGNVLYTGWIFLFLNRRKKLDNMLFESRTTNQNDLLELLENVEEIKANNIGNRRRWKWEFSRYNIYGLRVKNMNLDQVEATGAMFIMQLQGIFITWIAAVNVVNGVMTLGMMMAAQYILGQLSAPINAMIGYVHSLQFARISLRRVNEVILDEVPESSRANMDVPLEKSIEIKNLCFSYKPNLNKVLTKINLTIPEGKVTAIVGESGSGKTTLIKLLMRFYEPTEGEIEIGGGVPIENIELFKWRKSCGAVLQDGKLFNDTILYNITLEDEEPNINKEQLLKAIRFTNIEGFIEQRPLKLYTPLGTNGSGLSQGQKQRLLIARAIYKDPDFLFLDEATNALDSNNEKYISKNLESILKGKTAVVIAHRLSTVKNAHNIIVLDKGRIVEEGNHSKLISQKGVYYQLVKNQLELD